MTRSQLTLLRDYGIRPVKRRGQNFLVDGNLARAIAQEILDCGEQVLELGAGGGALTGPLLAAGARVVSVEVDRKLCALLRQEFAGQENFTLLEDDLARLDWQATLARVGPAPVVAGNLPYVLTSSVLFALARWRPLVAGGVFMVQKEVAERLVAGPGGRDYGVLSVVLGGVYRLRIVRSVPAAVFWPRPEVASALVRLDPAEIWPEQEFDDFVRIVKTIFGGRRKKLGTQLRAHFGLDPTAVASLTTAAGCDPELRPEQITVAGFRNLARQLAGREPS